MAKIKILTIVLLTISFLHPQHEYKYYRPLIDYGSERFFNPVSLILNGSFDILRNGARTKNITAISYHNGYQNVIENITDPFRRIKKFGVNEFLAHEVLPLRGDINYFQYWPNYATHVIGNGMQYVKTAEWYDYNNIFFPRLMSLVTITFFQLMNEVVEHSGRTGINIDPIADILIFNPLGILLFNFELVQNFFSKTVKLNDWSLMPMYATKTNQIENAGQQFSMKFKIPKIDRFKGFIFWGIQGMAGISYPLINKYSISFAGGVIVNNVYEKNTGRGKFLAPNLDGALGIFYDRNNSLLTSIIITGPKLYNCRLNIFPGVLRLRKLDIGLYFGIGEWDNMVFGINFMYFPIGLMANIK